MILIIAVIIALSTVTCKAFLSDPVIDKVLSEEIGLGKIYGTPGFVLVNTRYVFSGKEIRYAKTWAVHVADCRQNKAFFFQDGKSTPMQKIPCQRVLCPSAPMEASLS